MTEKFRPEPEPSTNRQIMIRMHDPEEFKAIDEAAKKFRISKQAFCRQALLFALKHMDESS